MTTIRKVDGKKLREEASCGCAWLWEPPPLPDGEWVRRPVARCGVHAKLGRSSESRRVPPKVTE